MRALTGGAILLLLAFVSPGDTRADTFPMHGTEKFESGLQKLATITFARDFDVDVDWGDGTPFQPGLRDCGLVGACDIYGTHRYAAVGTYTITIHYVAPITLFAKTETTTATIVHIGDFVILSIGDSVGSGEGNPPVSGHGYWDDPGSDYGFPAEHACHRSRDSGPGLTARTVAATNPVTFVHFACSGNDVAQTISGLRSARGRLPRIDVVLVSAGANEVSGGFGNLLTSCLLNPVGEPCSENDALKATIASDIASLHGKYETLGQSIACRKIDDQGNNVFDQGNCGHMVEPVPPLVLITEYFDPTHDGDGDFPSEAESITCGLGLIQPSEWEFLYNNMVVPMNAQVRASAPQSPDFPRYTRWEPVVGMQQDFLTHGYCANPGPTGLLGDSWIVKAPDSIANQGDQYGTGHPNLDGQADYRSRTYARLKALNPPRTTAAATADGQPYTFGTWTGKDVDVELAARNPLKESGVGDTYYAVDDPDCVPDGDLVAHCTVYNGPFTIDTSGQHTVTYFSFNSFEGREPPKSAQVWIDKDPPVMTCTADPSELWPPNGKLVHVQTSVEAVDAVFGPMPFTLIATSTSQGNPQADIKGFDIGKPDTDGALRARRDGKIPAGRLYQLVYESADPLGNVGRCTIRIDVPHDQRKTGHSPKKPGRPARQ